MIQSWWFYDLLGIQLGLPQHIYQKFAPRSYTSSIWREPLRPLLILIRLYELKFNSSLHFSQTSRFILVLPSNRLETFWSMGWLYLHPSVINNWKFVWNGSFVSTLYITNSHPCCAILMLKIVSLRFPVRN